MEPRKELKWIDGVTGLIAKGPFYVLVDMDGKIFATEGSRKAIVKRAKELGVPYLAMKVESFRAVKW